MSAQVLNAKSVRRIERTIGEPVLRGWGHGSYSHAFVTPDHRHGWVNIKTWEFGWDDPDNLVHYASCHELFPDPDDWIGVKGIERAQ